MTKEVKRLGDRMRLALPARVRGRDSAEQQWNEKTRLVDVSPFGACFRLSRPTEPGRLLLLITAMPVKLRVFDYAEDQYRVWCIVRSVKMLDPVKEKGALIEVGVAFIGKRPPKSYETNPAQRYAIAQGRLENGHLETVAEELSEVIADDKDKRKESRQLIPVEVLIEVFDDGKLVNSENTVTENITQHGAAVFTALDLVQGTFVKMSSERYNASVLAIVRHIRKGAEGMTRLHLEFVGGEWPL